MNAVKTTKIYFLLERNRKNFNVFNKGTYARLGLLSGHGKLFFSNNDMGIYCVGMVVSNKGVVTNAGKDEIPLQPRC